MKSKRTPVSTRPPRAGTQAVGGSLEQLLNTVHELNSIVEATKQLNSTLDLGELIHTILAIATRHTGAERGTLFLYDRERGEIWSLVGLGLEQQEIRLSASRGIAGWVTRHGETVSLADAYQDPRFEPEVDRWLGYRTRSLLCLPTRNKEGEIVAVLQLLNKPGDLFTTADESFLKALSEHVALALENAQLHRERLAKQRLERDLELARIIQAGLLPEAAPALPGFDMAVSHRTAQMVGGDYYDFISLDPATLLMVVADVEGKGVASALVLANLQAMMHALVAHLHSLERLVGAFNHLLSVRRRGSSRFELVGTSGRPSRYVSMFLALLDQRHSGLHYINAGHIPPAVVRPNGEVVYLEEGGMVIGLFPEAAYQRGFVRLGRGDLFVACTDGITEAMNAKEEEYGRARLVEAMRSRRNLPAMQIVNETLGEVGEFSRRGTHEDDRILLVLKAL